MKRVAIVQARMGSTRLPGKVLMPILGKPMLEGLIGRISQASKVDQVTVATSLAKCDDPIYRLVEKLHGVGMWRGSESDVLERYYEAAIASKADIILRVTADNPFFCADVADTLISMVQEGYDYAANNLERTYPYGIDLEAFTFAALAVAHSQATESYQREHVTPYIRENPDVFRHSSLRWKQDLSHIRLTVDSRQDYLRARELFERFGPDVQFQEIAECQVRNSR